MKNRNLYYCKKIRRFCGKILAVSACTDIFYGRLLIILGNCFAVIKRCGAKYGKACQGRVMGYHIVW